MIKGRPWYPLTPAGMTVFSKSLSSSRGSGKREATEPAAYLTLSAKVPHIL